MHGAANPLLIVAALVLLAAGLVVHPLMKMGRLDVTPSKLAALAIAAGVCAYSGRFALLIAFLWPLSFIWFPEYWGGYTGFLRGAHINEKSPPLLVSIFGWLFLIGFPLLFWWIAG